LPQCGQPTCCPAKANETWNGPLQIGQASEATSAGGTLSKPWQSGQATCWPASAVSI
jgi:hypothetical protein